MKTTPNLDFESYDLTKEYFSIEKDSNFSIKSKEIANLDKPRKLGLSGHLRAKNESFSIKEAIESSIEALDELIITCQPYINKSGKDETYEICKEAKRKYGEKIKLFYYTPQTNSFNGSHVNNNNDKHKNTSIHSFAHYSNFGLKEISYKYYMKIDADQIYFTPKLKALKDAIIHADKYTKNNRNFFDKILGKMFEPFLNLFVKILPLKQYIVIVTMINKRVAFGLSGIQLTISNKIIRGGQEDCIRQNECVNYKPTSEIKAKIDTLLQSPIRKSLLRQMAIPLKIHYDRFYTLNGGCDHIVFSPDSKNLYFYFEDHGVETQNLIGTKCIRNIGCFWAHLGMIKRYFVAYGVQNKDYISIENFLNTPIQNLDFEVKAHYKSDYKGAIDNIKLHLENDKKYLRKIL